MRQRHQLLDAAPYSGVVLELIWVLSSVYGYSRNDILDAIDELLGLSVIQFENPESIRTVVRNGRSSSTDLADLLIGVCGREAGATQTKTFDRNAAKSDLFELITGS